MTQRSVVPSSRSALLRTIALALIVAVGASGCGKIFKKDKDSLEGRSVEALYQEAHEAMTHSNWAKAEIGFRALIAQYPYGPYTEQAMMETAYAQYKAGKLDDAISSIDRYIRTYPTQRNIPYMYYLRGLANSSRDAVFLQKVWRLDASRRDLATPMQGYNDFSTVAERYPNSRYAADARARMIGLRDQFARHELETAVYYLRRDAWVAAAGRAKYLLETYPQSGFQNDAVAVLGEAYTHLGNETLAADARRVLELNDPQHPWLSGDWPKQPWLARRLNPFASEKSAVDYTPPKD
ncbi:outer membrane protein assembly factor BamD [Pseudoxanthomonas kalamensis DSM 18571]|uniref:outer membrane protein assembly factor BamD n=1 Tax=Pseudoxanthomonas kalamensis TaxID=289483 RepID=UPI0013919126|nr:outer membrane protein assembly factor BamD [Pseudoxanthomonas kalamensis]KAF1708821.1 outer membrane protein assembly factor BamD [Pseudoxanthomonas kalamensis DSM 18571]